MANIPFNITASKKDCKAMIRITGTIGLDVQAELFRSQVDELVKDGITDAHLYISSPGGSVFDAAEIVNIIKDSFSGEITGEGGALVASAATYIALHCDSFAMPANGMFMIHKPSGGAEGAANKIETYLRLLKKIEEQYFDIYQEKAKNKALLKRMWNNGDWWMTAQEALDNGFITSVGNSAVVDKQTNALIAACGCPTEKLPSQEGDLSKICALLDITNTSDTKTILRAIAEIKGQKLPDDMVKDAIAKGYVHDYEKQELLAIATTSPNTFAQMLESV